jgi:hypothetical protein
MRIEAEFHNCNMLIAPLVSLCLLECQNPECPRDMCGIGLELGWLFWTVRIGVQLPI